VEDDGVVQPVMPVSQFVTVTVSTTFELFTGTLVGVIVMVKNLSPPGSECRLTGAVPLGLTTDVALLPHAAAAMANTIPTTAARWATAFPRRLSRV
jgi:hypothetical protein